MRAIIVILVLVTAYLQYLLWFGPGGIREVERLQRALEEQRDEIAKLEERNRGLAAEVMDLKQGLEAVEERARSEMGMVREDELFFRLIDPQGAGPDTADEHVDAP